MSTGRPRGRPATRDPDGLWWSLSGFIQGRTLCHVPGRPSCRTGQGHNPSKLGHGCQDHPRQCNDDEQGIGGTRARLFGLFHVIKRLVYSFLASIKNPAHTRVLSTLLFLDLFSLSTHRSSRPTTCLEPATTISMS